MTALRFNNNERFDRIKKMPTKEFNLWIKQEKEYWSQIHEILSHRKDEMAQSQNVSVYLSVLSNATYEDLNGLEGYHDSIPLPFHDDVPNASRLLDLTGNGQFSLAIYAFNTSLISTSHFYIKTYESDLWNAQEKLKIEIDAEKSRFTESLDERLEHLKSSVDETQKTVHAKIQHELDTSKLEIANTVQTATSAILSAEPVRYWVEREAKHKTEAAKFLRLISIASLIFVSALVFLTVSVYRNGIPYEIAGITITIPDGKYSIALLVIATTGSIWLIRVLVKLMMTNLALEIEALERSTMIRTFIAINNTQPENSDDIRTLFYSTLFKPSSDNLTDDSASPEYIRIIEALFQKKT